MLRPDPVGIFGLAAVALCWFLAGFLYRSGPGGGLARRLAFLMAVEGLALATSGVPDWLLPLEVRETATWYPGWVLANGVVHFVCDALLLVWYPGSWLQPSTRPWCPGWAGRGPAGGSPSPRCCCCPSLHSLP